MSKYIYYNGKIYETSKLNHHTLFSYKPNGSKDIYEEYYIGLHRVSYLVDDGKAKWFDSFEDLIEVGDLVFALNYIGSIEPIIIDENMLSDNRQWLNVWFSQSTEIWKKVEGRTYKRICHKEEGNWVID